MKIKLIVTVISICSFNLFSVSCYSQSSSKGFMGSIGAGISFPLSDFEEYSKTGFEIGFKGGYKFNNNFVSGLAVDYDYFPHKADSILISGFSTNVLSLTAFLMAGNFRKNVKLNPYFLFGTGFYFRNSNTASTIYGVAPATECESYFGLNIGAGLAYRVLNNGSIFIESKYTGNFDTPYTIFITVKAGAAIGL